MSKRFRVRRTARLSLEPIGMPDLAWFIALNRRSEVHRQLWDGRSIESAEAIDIIVRSVDAFAREGYGLRVGQSAEADVSYYGLWCFF